MVRSSCGLTKHLLWRPHLHDDAAVHEGDAVRGFLGEADLVGHDHHGHALVGQLLHDVQHLSHQLRVEGRGRLVEEHQLRLHGEGPGYRDPLLLAAGQLRRIDVELLRETDLAQQLLGVGFRLLLVGLLDPDGRLHHVLDGRQMREQVEPLEDHADLRTLAGHITGMHLVQDVALLPVAHELAVDPQPAGVDLLEVVDAA